MKSLKDRKKYNEHENKIQLKRYRKCCDISGMKNNALNFTYNT